MNTHGKERHFHCVSGCEKAAGDYNKPLVLYKDKKVLACANCGAPFVECDPDICL